MRFNPPPGWPQPPTGWVPPAGWTPDPSWPTPPADWRLWLPDDPTEQPETTTLADPGDGGAELMAAEPGESSEGEAEAVPDAPGDTTAQTRGDSRGVSSATATDSAQADELRRRIADLEAALARAGGAAGDGAIDLDDQRMLQDVGVYRYHHPLEDAAAYKGRLRQLEMQMDEIIKAGRAVLAADMFTFSGSLARGRKMVADLSKLMLRAYNAEADNCVRSLRAGNVTLAKKRLQASVTAIERLGVIMEMRVNPEYHDLRVQELELTADFQMKVQEERERAREERELLREQRRAEQELAAERERLEKEKAHYLSAMAALEAKGDDKAVAELASRLAEIDEAIVSNDYRIANIRAGYVYVISNVGALGQNIVKIGMTRRLEPLDRVRELGDASVPFPYDVHALFFSDDAITLENQLHKAFAERRVNFVNERREFFFATLEEVRAQLQERTGGLLEFTEKPEALEYYQSKGRWLHREVGDPWPATGAG